VWAEKWELIELRFYVPSDTNEVTSETVMPAGLSPRHTERNLTAFYCVLFCWCYFLIFLNVALSFDNTWTDRNADCVNIVNKKITSAKNLVHFGQGTLPWQPILWRKTATNWQTTPLLFMLAFHNKWEYRNIDYMLYIDDNASTSIKKFVNFGPVTPEILFLISMNRRVHTWPKYAVRWFLKVIRYHSRSIIS